MNQFTRHIILDKRDIADLVNIISSTDINANLAMKVHLLKINSNDK